MSYPSSLCSEFNCTRSESGNCQHSELQHIYGTPIVLRGSCVQQVTLAANDITLIEQVARTTHEISDGIRSVSAEHSVQIKFSI